MKATSKNSQSVISQKKFKTTDSEVQGGSAPIRKWFLDENNTEWFGKCSMSSLASEYLLESTMNGTTSLILKNA